MSREPCDLLPALVFFGYLGLEDLGKERPLAVNIGEHALFGFSGKSST
jgi:hypothetical protein